MTSILMLAGVLLICIIFEAFFSGSEITFLSANRARLFRRAKEKDPRALVAKDLLSHPETLFSTTIVGTTFSINCASALCAFFVINRYAYDKEWYTLVFLTPVILIFGEFVPKMLGRTNADALVLKLA